MTKGSKDPCAAITPRAKGRFVLVGLAFRLPVATCLLHEERYFLKSDPGKDGAHQVLCEERYCGRFSGFVIASRPPRPILEANSLNEGREILDFFHEVSAPG